MNTRCCGPALLALAALLCLAPVRAEAGALRDRIDSLAADITAELKARRLADVAIGDFAGPRGSRATAGPALQLLLREALEKLGVKVDPKSHQRLTGEYSIVPEKEVDEELVVRIVVALRPGRSPKVFGQEVSFRGNGNEDIIALLGLQADLSKRVKAIEEDRNLFLKKWMANAPLRLKKGAVRTTSASPCAVEFLVKAKRAKQFKPAEAREENGRAVVELAAGDEFALRLKNESNLEAAAFVTIDGIDALHFFEPAAKRPAAFLVPAASSREVSAWPRSATEGDRFVAGEYAATPMARALLKDARRATVTVVFCACWEGKKPPPEYEGFHSAPLTRPMLGGVVNGRAVVRDRSYRNCHTAISIGLAIK